MYYIYSIRSHELKCTTPLLNLVFDSGLDFLSSAYHHVMVNVIIIITIILILLPIPKCLNFNIT